MPFFHRRLTAVLILSALTLPAPLWAAAKNSILLYTSAPSRLMKPLEEEFRKLHPTQNLRVFRARASTVLGKLEREWRSGSPRAHVLWAGDASVFLAYKKAGRLSPFSPPEAKTIPADLKDPDGYFHAVRLLHLVIAYNQELIASAPAGFRDILALKVSDNPSEKKGLSFALPSPETSGASLAAFTAWTQSPSTGWTFIRSLMISRPLFTENFQDTVKLVMSGKTKAALLTDHIAYKSFADSQAMQVVWPSGGTVTISGPAGILKRKNDSEGARLLIRFLLSKSAQEIIRESGLYAARADIPPPKGRPRLGEIKRIPVKWENTGADDKTIVRRFRALRALARRKASQKK